jgi:2-oxopent-4-enoate hydratase
MTATTHDALLAGLAAELLDAARTRVPIPPLTARHPQLTVADAYAIQGLVARARLDAGAVLVGRKVGLTSAAMQQMMGVGEPDFGRVFADELIDGGGEVPLAELIQPRAEPEIAFMLASDLAGPGVTVADALAATAYVSPALEVIDSRVADWRIALVDTVADNASSGRVVLGAERVPVGDVDLAAATVALRIDGEQVAEGRGDAVLGHPAEAVAWLANTLAPFGERLRAGDLVMPGSMTAAAPLAPGATVVADYGPLGTVEVTCR